VDVLKRLRMLAATAAAAIAGVVTMASGPSEPAPVILRPGDLAPDFTLSGSDGRTYHLREILAQGYGAVIAWFPKAFTGG
jgi:thioredoxin-dependent peroxiredoxin